MILSIDTATPHVVVGLVGPGVREERAELVERRHAERLPALAADLLSRDIELVVVGTGPGSYTGLRVGASYALGIGRARGVTILGVSTLEAIAAAREGRVAVSIDARKGNVYGAVYDVHDGLVEGVVNAPRKWPIEEFEEVAGHAIWVRDEAPSGIALARLGEPRGTRDWSLVYL